MKKVIDCKLAPAAVGPYSQAIQVDRFLYVSGQLPVDIATGKFVDGGVKEQTVKVLENVEAILKEAGYSFENVVKSTVYLTDMANFASMNEVYASFFKEPYPARVAFAVVGLPLGAMVEIDVVAFK